MSSFSKLLKSHAERVEHILMEVLGETPRVDEIIRPERLLEAMRYAALDGGKRLRPFLVMESAALFDVPYDQSVYAGSALECIHCYSLVHDDLPAMDDDDLRRSKPTVHKAFDEATAILAGDGLLTIAFDVLADEKTHVDGGVRVRLVQLYAQNAGIGGMTGGQMLDLEAESKTLSMDEILTLQAMKTGALIRCACVSGGILGNASKDETQHLHRFGELIGQAFQLKDDILDVTSDDETMGKRTSKDAEAGKGTLVTLLGLEACEKQAQELLEKANEELSIFGDKANTLNEVARFIIEREK